MCRWAAHAAAVILVGAGVWLAARPAGAQTSASASASAPCGDGPATASAPLMPVAIGHSNVAPGLTPLWLTEAAGLFRRYGLDVTVHEAGAGGASVAALERGDVQVLFTAGPGPVAAIVNGADLAIFGGYSDRLPFQLLARPEVPNVAALRGQVIAINQPGGASGWALSYMLQEAGLDPERDVELRVLGTDAQRLAAVRAGDAAATLLAPPFHVQAQRAGLHVLVNAATLPLLFSQSLLVAERAYLDAHPDVSQAILLALADGLRCYRDDEALATSILSARMGFDAELSHAAWDYYRDVFSDDFEPRGLTVILEETLRAAPERPPLTIADLLDLRALRALQAAGRLP